MGDKHRVELGAATIQKLSACGPTLRTLAAHAVRRGKRRIMLTPNPGPRFGNFLYYWLHASIRRSQGVDFRVETHNHLRPWLTELDRIREELSIETSALRPFDRREWPPQNQLQNVGLDFTPTQLEAFVRRYLLSSRLLAHLRPGRNDEVVLNVRRGDYYSDPRFKELYGFDIASYVGVALQQVERMGAVRHITVISDDLGWCRRHLHHLLHSSVSSVSYGGRAPGPRGDFRTLATAQRLIGSNSSFCYWGAYVSSTVFDYTNHILMPGFMSTKDDPIQLLESWDVVSEVPGGWRGHVE